MIRVLFIILAVVSMVLAFVLSISWLYLVSAGMLITAAVILTLDTRKRLRRSSVAGSKPVPVEAPKDDLTSFGIMEIRPVDKSRKKTEGTPAAGAAEPTAVPEPRPAADQAGVSSEELVAVQPVQSVPDSNGGPAGATAASQPVDRARISGVGVVRKRAKTAKIMVEGVSEHLRGEVVLSILRGLRSAVGATTVTLLKEERSPLGYSVEAMVSQNSFARSGGHFTVAEPLLSGGAPLTATILRCNGPKGFNARRLGYYHEPIAINKVAMVPLTGGTEAFLLVCDSMSPDAFQEGDSARMLGDFGRLIQSLVRAEPDSGSLESPSPLRPRREIIAEEIATARSAAQPLALALVHLNGADDLDDVDRVAAEGMMADRLAASAHDARVERFGELTYGVLRKTSADDAARWASRLLQEFKEEPGGPDGGLSVGVAMLSERHQGADALRADATAALRESYETGECIILE